MKTFVNVDSFTKDLTRFRFSLGHVLRAFRQDNPSGFDLEILEHRDLVY